MTAMTPTATTNTLSKLAAGFPNPVHDAQTCFRAVMNAMARPGCRQPHPLDSLQDAPAPLTPMLAAIALTLLDYDTPVWLDAPLVNSEDARAFLAFHTNAPIVAEPVDAAFALVSDSSRPLSLSSFAQGTPEYPDTSTTVVVAVEDWETPQVLLQGPGIKTSQDFGCTPLPPLFWSQMQANNGQYPRGIDVIFAGPQAIAAVPRSTTITLLED